MAVERCLRGNAERAQQKTRIKGGPTSSLLHQSLDLHVFHAMVSSDSSRPSPSRNGILEQFSHSCRPIVIAGFHIGDTSTVTINGPMDDDLDIDELVVPVDVPQRVGEWYFIDSTPSCTTPISTSLGGPNGAEQGVDSGSRLDYAS